MNYLNIDNYDKEIELRKQIEISKSIKYKRIREKINIIKTIKKKKKKTKRKLRKRKTIRSYRTYIKSSLWTKRKNKYFSKYGKKCEACNKPKYVTLHHAIYSGEYGNEPDTEVFALCGECHHHFHENHKLKKDMLKETIAFIEEVKAHRYLIWESKKLDVIIN